MPLVTFDLPPETSDQQVDAILSATQRGLVRSIGVPEHDLFQIVHRHAPGELRADPTWGGVERKSVLYIGILAVRAHYGDKEMKEMFTAIAEEVSATGVRREDVFVYVQANTAVDWSAGTS